MANNEAKKKSTILKDALALFVITLISGLALSFVYEITKAPIKEQENAKKFEALQGAYLEADTIGDNEKLAELAKNTDLTKLNSAFAGITINEINTALDKSGNVIGHILQISTTQGYKDVIKIAVGYSLDKTVKGMEIISINETAGLGMNANTPEFKNQFVNKKVDQFVTTKTGASSDNEINAISSATITSDAIVNAVNAGLSLITENPTEFGGGLK